MIKVIDDWYIEVESNPTNYTVKRGKGVRDKNGKNRDKIYGYYGSLLNALKALRKEIVTDKLKDGTYTLVEAVDTIIKADERFEKIMERVTACSPAHPASTTTSAWSAGEHVRNM